MSRSTRFWNGIIAQVGPTENDGAIERLQAQINQITAKINQARDTMSIGYAKNETTES